MSRRNYTVIVYPPPPATRGREGMSTQTVAVPPRVVTVPNASTPQEAADRASVAPGGRALVVVDGRAFTRAEQAPLEEVSENWQPLPQAAPA